MRIIPWVLFALSLAGFAMDARGAEQAKLPTPFEAMDRHALAAPDSVASSPASLAAYLTKPAGNPWEKTRAIFRWITDHIDYDIESLLAGRRVSLDPEVVLERRKAVCAGYAKLFVRLCEEAGLEAKYLTGHSREYGEETSEWVRRLFGKQVGHAWNAVKLGGQWHLLDATWGAGFINDQGQFVRAFDPHYFLTRPVEFIHTHYPDDPQWQLLPQPVKRSVYDRLVHVRSGFFRHGLTLASHRLMDIPASGPLKITLGAPEDVVLFATVERKERGSIPLRLTLAQRQGKMYEIHACFPEAGDYRLRIFSQRKGTERTDRLQWALGYQVQVRGAAKECAGYPTTFAGFHERAAYLTAPLASRLASHSPHLFQLSVPGAEEVYVETGGRPIPLENRGNQFSGSVLAQPGELFLFAQFPGESFATGLLKYLVE